jgi:DNA-binding NarL/FixJ family response regulator
MHPAMTCSQAKPRILLADDHPAALAQAVHVLEERNEIVGTVPDGLELLDAAGRLDPDLVVLDISMPGLGGFDAARRLKQSGSRSKLVFLTVWEDPDFVREALALGAEAYVVKSRLASDLLHAVSEVMSGRKFISPGLIP